MRQSLLEHLQHYAQQSPEKIVYSFLNKDKPSSITFSQLEIYSKKIAHALIEKKLSPGERALIILPQSLDYLLAFWGCLYAQVIAVPLYPPLRPKHIARIIAVAEDSKSSILITNSEIETMLENSSPEIHKNLRIFNIDKDLPKSRMPLPEPSQSTCFLQYTSGSTGTPKGVMVSYERLDNNLKMMKHSFAIDESSTAVSWLPLFHDLGLIGKALASVFNGFSLYLFDPIQFIRNPLCWLEAISKYRATQSFAPNFAYDLCINEVTEEQKRCLDLSCWKIALNAAEPVRHATIEKFTEKFASCGFHLATFNPAYGMAEATLYASGKKKMSDLPETEEVSVAALKKNIASLTSDTRDIRQIVSCGVPGIHSKIYIVDPESLSRLPARHVGEIWISGAHICEGYWEKSELSKKVFQAYTADGKGPFLRSGDLGYINEKGALFFVGRLKNLIIIRGKNFVPNDIEFTIEESCKGVKAHFTICFSVDREEQEHLIVVMEIRSPLHKNELETLKKKIRRSVLQTYDIRVSEVVFVAKGGIPKTTSGKLQHQLCKKLYLEKKLPLFSEALCAPIRH